MRPAPVIDPGHDRSRAILGTVGPLIALAGLVFTVVGIGDFFASFGSMQIPHYFWCAFVGLPLLFVGMAISSFAYLGTIVRYQSQEVAPVAKDTFNYLAQGTSEGVHTVAQAVAEGLVSGMPGSHGSTVLCPKCKRENSADSQFCKACGGRLLHIVACRICGQGNDSDAKYCRHCGGQLA